jgi:hypothetical protein
MTFGVKVSQLQLLQQMSNFQSRKLRPNDYRVFQIGVVKFGHPVCSILCTNKAINRWPHFFSTENLVFELLLSVMKLNCKESLLPVHSGNGLNRGRKVQKHSKALLIE